MAGDPNRPFPPGVPQRRRRPLQEADNGGAVVGALVGLLFSQTPAGALIGGLVGKAATPQNPLPLELALRNALLPKGFSLAQLYRHGPRRVRILINRGDGYWTLESQMPLYLGLGQDDIDDWLYGDLLDYQLPQLGRGRP
jgi:hypothetical protein